MSGYGDRGDTKANEQMTQVQKRTFTRWVNHFLSERMMKVDDLFVDLKDGVFLINLLEVISSKSLGKYDKKPKMLLNQIGNLNIALEFIKSEGLKLVNIGAEEINAGNPKLILGLIWTLILRYQIQMGGDGGSPKQELLDWVNKQIAPYGHIEQAKDFTKSWQDGKVLAALTDSLKPGIINTKALSDPLRDTQNAMDLATQHYSIPQFVDANDMVNNPDEHSNMTYIAAFRDYLENKAKHKDQYKLKGPDPAHCFAVGRGVQGGFARRPLPFTIHSRTVNDAPVTGKWIRPMEVQVTGPSGDVKLDELRDNKDGTFFGKYCAPVAGAYKVRIQVVPDPDGDDGADKSDIKGSVYNLVVKEPSDPNKSFAEGPGLERVYDDQPAKFTVHCRDKDDRPVIGDNVAVTVEQVEVAPDTKRPSMGDKVPVELKDNGDGTWAVKYDAIVPGKYRVNVTINGEPIRDMPKDVMCYRPFDAAQSIATGPGVTSGAPRVGHEAPFKVIVKDKQGNPVVAGGHDVKAVVTGPKGPIPVAVKDDGNGTYSCAYTPTAAGDHVVDVTIAGQPIKDNPFKVQVKKPADPAKSYAEGPGLVQAWDNKPNVFKVFAKDEDGLPVSGEPVKVTVTPKDGKSAAPVDVKDNGDGTYDVVYKTDTPGDYVINATIRDVPIKDMPKNVTCHKGVDPTKSTVTGPGVEGGLAGRDLPFVIKTFDKDGNPVKVGNADIVAKVLGPNKQPIKADLKDNKDGTYSGVYRAAEPGPYRVMVILDQEHPLGKSPYNLTVRPGAAPHKSFAQGRGWKEAYDALPTLFTIYARDEQGQPVPGEKVRVVMRNVTTPAEQAKLDAEIAAMDEYIRNKKLDEIKRIELERKHKQDEARKAAEAEGKAQPAAWTDPEGDVAVEVRDNGDGSYLANYTAAKPGHFEISVTVGEDGQHIKDSPNKIPVHLSKPQLVFWSHTYSREREELALMKKRVAEYEDLLKKNNLLPQ